MKKAYITILIISGVFLRSVELFSQDNTLFFMDKLQQALHTNPAYQPHSRVYVNFILPSLSLAVNYNGFGYYDAIHFGNGSKSDSLVIDLNQIVDKMPDISYLATDVRYDLLAVGFKAKKMYFHFGISNRTETWTGIPKNIITALTEGNLDYENDVVRSLDFSGIGFSAINYFEYSFGLSAPVNDNFTLGFRLKYLKGAANILTERSDIMLATENDGGLLRLTGDLRINSSVAVTPIYDQNNEIQDFDTDNTFDDPVNDYILNKNNGFAMDIGATYKVSEKLSLSASLTDFGLIKWKTNTLNIETNSSFVTQGIDLYPLIDDNDSRNFEDLIDDLADSLENAFNYSNEESEYNTFLTSKIYIGVKYHISEKVNFGALLKTKIYDNKLHPSFTIAANFVPCNWFNAGLTYNLMNGNYTNLGVGLALRAGPVQFFFITDNIIPIYTRTRSLNLQFGFNWVFGNKVKVDVQSIESSPELK